MLNSQVRYEKQKASLRYRLLGKASENKDWYTVVAGLEYADEKHKGQLRKDGITPYIAHPIEATLYVLTLPSLLYPIRTAFTMLNHDVLEDTSTTYQNMADEFGQVFADDVACMSKKVDGQKKTPHEYWGAMAQSAVASIGKPADRIANQHTMGGVYDLNKQLSTIEDTEEYVFPLMKVGRRKFPQQELAYENAKLVLSTQLSLHRAVLIAQGLLPGPTQ